MAGILARSLGRGVAVAAAAGLIVPPTAANAQADPVGMNAAIRNRVQIRNAGTSQVQPAVLKARAMLNEEVRTGPGSQLQILLLDRSTFTVGADARVTVDRFVFNPATNSRSTVINVARGAFRFMSGRMLDHPSGPANVRTPVASIGIRGTIFEGAVGPATLGLAALQPEVAAMHPRPDPKNATFVILRGPGPNTQGDTRPGAIDVIVGGRTIVLDRPGTALFIPGLGQQPIGPFPVAFAVLQAMQPLLRTTPDMAPAARQGLNEAGGEGAGPGAAAGPGGGHGFSFLLLGAVPLTFLALILFHSDKSKNMPTSP